MTTMNENPQVYCWKKLHNEDAPTVILVHGLASSSNGWKHLAYDLFNNGYNVYVPDLYGHGKSERLTEYSLEQMVSGLAETLPNAPELLVGHSVGGLIAAALQPRLQAKKLVMIDPLFFLPKGKFLLKGIQGGFLQALFIRSLSLNSQAMFTKNLKKRIAYRREFVSWMRWDTKTVSILKPSPNLIAETIKQQTAKVLIIRAKGSYIAPAHRLKGAEAFNVKVVSLSNNHNIHMVKYDELLKEVLNFLKPELTVA